MINISEIEKACKKIAPYDTAAEWDNVGLLVGDDSVQIDKVLLALDITAQVVEEARDSGAGLIVSHHPVIFDPLRSLAPDDPVYLLAKYDIAALCLHTNLDRAKNGVNTALAEALGLKNTVLFPDDFICVGEPGNKCKADAFAALVKERLSAPSVRYTDGHVSRVAVSSGSGGEGVELHEQYGFDAFVTGELKHHHYIYASSHGIAAFDAGHFSTEDVITEPLRMLLSDEFPDVAFIKSETCACPYRAL